MATDDNSDDVLTATITLLVFCWVTVGLRVYCRACVIRSFGVDDALVVGLLLIFTVHLSFQLVAWKYGMGRHRDDLASEDNTMALMWWFICELLYIICSCLIKLAVASFLLRIAIRTVDIYILRSVALVTIVYSSAYFIIAFLQCRPINSFWTESPRAPGKCWNDTLILSTGYTTSVLSCIIDWTLGILPLFIVRSLNLSKNTKVLVTVLLAFAAIGSIATIMRMVYMPQILEDDEFLFATTDVAIWSTVEAGVGLAAVSIATLRPLWHYWRYQLGLEAYGPDVEAWVARNRYNRQRADSMRAASSDPRFNNRLPKLRPDNVLSVTKVSTTAANTLSSPLGTRHSLEGAGGGGGGRGNPSSSLLRGGGGGGGITITTEWSLSRRDATYEDWLTRSLPEPDHVARGPDGGRSYYHPEHHHEGNNHIVSHGLIHLSRFPPFGLILGSKRVSTSSSWSTAWSKRSHGSSDPSSHSNC